MEQEEEFNLTARASHRDRNWGVLTKTPRGRGFLLLGLIIVSGPFKWHGLCEAVSGRVTILRLWDSVLEIPGQFSDSPGTDF